MFRQLVRLRPCERDVLAALAVILLAPFLIHGPELLGLVSCDPLARASRLTEALSTAPHFLLSGCVIDSNDGFTLQALGHLSAEDWLSGRLPWWNPYSGAGMPLAAEMQPASFYLPFILLLHFADGVLYIKIVTQLLAGLGMFMCLRQLRASAGAAVLGALMFEFNGSFAWYGDTTILPVPFLPLLIAGIDRAREAALPPVAGGRWPVAGGRWPVAGGSLRWPLRFRCWPAFRKPPRLMACLRFFGRAWRRFRCRAWGSSVFGLRPCLAVSPG